MADPKNPTLGSFDIDGTEFETYCEDLPPGALLGFLCTREGFDEACQELITSQVTHGKAAGISDGEVTDLSLINERVDRIDLFLPVYAKVVEMLTETRAKLDDQRERILLDAAKSVDRRAARSPSLLAKYEKTRSYRTAMAKKAMKTKAARAKLSDANKTSEPAAPPTA